MNKTKLTKHSGQKRHLESGTTLADNDLTYLLLPYQSLLSTRLFLCVHIHLKVFHLFYNHMGLLIPCPIMQGFVRKMILR